jgi:hypothetical protein
MASTTSTTVEEPSHSPPEKKNTQFWRIEGEDPTSVFWNRVKVLPREVHWFNWSGPKVTPSGANPHKVVDPDEVKLEKVIVQVSSAGGVAGALFVGAGSAEDAEEVAGGAVEVG